MTVAPALVETPQRCLQHLIQRIGSYPALLRQVCGQFQQVQCPARVTISLRRYHRQATLVRLHTSAQSDHAAG